MIRIKSLSLLILITVFSLGLSAPGFAEDGMVQDKDNLEKRGPGNMDVPLEKTPSASPKPTPQPTPKATPKAKDGK